MIELTCYDDNGNTISHLTQWDLNRVIYIENPEFSRAPLALFSNNENNSYLVATELTEDKNKIKITVPNLLLQQHKTIVMGLCSFDIINNINNTKYILKLPVHQLAMPTSYIYTDNAVDLNWLRNLLGDYINKGITDIDTAGKNGISQIQNSLSAAVNNIDSLTAGKLGDINNTAASQINAINSTSQSQIEAINNTASSQISAINQTAQSQTESLNNTAFQQLSAINTTAQSQAESIEGLTEVSISKLGYYTGTTDIIILQESDQINVENYSTFVLTNDGGIAERNFTIQVHQYDSADQLIDSSYITVGQAIDISEASYITLFGAGSSGTFTLTYRISRDVDVLQNLSQLSGKLNGLASNSTFGRDFSSNTSFGIGFASNADFANTFAINNTFGSKFAASNTSFANTLAKNYTFANSFASNSTFASAFASNSTFASTLASNSTFANTFALNAAFASAFASNSTFASTFAFNSTFTDCLASNYTFVDRLLYALPFMANQTVVPVPSAEDSGKILAVTSTGSLSWITP